jgi:hypothetical protein
MTRVTLGKSRMRESRTSRSGRAKAEWLSYSTVIALRAPKASIAAGKTNPDMLSMAVTRKFVAWYNCGGVRHAGVSLQRADQLPAKASRLGSCQRLTSSQPTRRSRYCPPAGNSPIVLPRVYPRPLEGLKTKLNQSASGES